jgi:formamidopyrimidine-DNA glycosylase
VPELPDIVVYLEALERHVLGETLREVRIASPFVLRSVEPPPGDVVGRRIETLRRIGKRIVIDFEDEYFFVLHLMIAGRLRWKKAHAAIPKKNGLAALDFDGGSVLFTEASRKQRASLHVVRGAAALETFHRGGIEVLDCGKEEFREALGRENHTLKRALTDPRLLSGIGNAYCDEILHAARLSPLRRTADLAPDEMERLYQATRDTLLRWIGRLRADVGAGFPDKVTAFRDGMAVHGRYRQPCPVCGNPVQRIRYAENEVNYCATCQTGGKVLADRALSRLLKDDWPRSIDEWEARMGEEGG